MRLISTAAVAVLLSGCIVVQKHPNTRPMPAEAIQSIGKANIAVSQSNNGVEKSWFMTDSSAAGAGYGLIGGLVTGIMDAIMNAGPQRRAGQAANEIAELVPADALTSSLVGHLQSQVPTADAKVAGVSIGSISTVQKLTSTSVKDGQVEIATTYTLSEDASAFRVTSQVTFEAKSLPYKTPYKFEKSVPKTELTGPVYRNTFTYHSAQLPVPSLTPDLVQRLVGNIEASYKDASGAPPKPDSDEGKKMAKELEQARDEKLTKDEIAIFLTREWVKDRGALLKQEIEGAHAFIAKYVVQDLNSSSIPSFEGQDQLVDTSTDRTVRRVGAGLDAGSYVSAPGNVTSFTTYGNAIAIAKVNSERISELRKQASAAKQKSNSKKKAA
jgi:hypothetical protein